MYCTYCGYRNPENVTNCYKCGNPMTPVQPPSGYAPPPPPPQTPPPPRPPYSPPPSGPGPQPPYYRPPAYSPPGGSVPNHLVWAILATIFCCLPFGIVAIIFAAQVNGKLQAGDYAGAVDSSRKAKMWSWIAFGSGLVVTVIYVAFVILGLTLGQR